MEDVADIFMKLHGQKRQSRRGVKQFVRYVRLIKEVWRGRYADTITGVDVRDYRDRRRKQGVAERAPSTASKQRSSRCLTNWQRGAGSAKSHATFSCPRAIPVAASRRSMRIGSSANGC